MRRRSQQQRNATIPESKKCSYECLPLKININVINQTLKYELLYLCNSLECVDEAENPYIFVFEYCNIWRCWYVHQSLKFLQTYKNQACVQIQRCLYSIKILGTYIPANGIWRRQTTTTATTTRMILWCQTDCPQETEAGWREKKCDQSVVGASHRMKMAKWWQMVAHLNFASLPAGIQPQHA